MNIKQIRIPTPAVPICDFCSSPAVIWRYPAMDSNPAAALIIQNKDEKELVLLNSEGDWAACEECAVLIEAEDKEGLLERTLAHSPELEGIPKHVVRTLTRSIHNGFWEHCFGVRIKMEGKL